MENKLKSSRKIGDIINLITKGTTPPKGKGFVDKGINYIKSDAVTYDRNLDRSKFVQIDEETHKAFKRSQLEENDILYSMAGIYLGKNAIVPKDVLPANTNQALAIIRLNQEVAYPNYVSLYLSQDSVIDYVNNMSGQSAQPNINFEEIKSIEIQLPPLPEQKAIASVLSSLDDKIDLLHQQNQTLEALAETLFRQWFIEEAKEDWEEGSFGSMIDLVVDNRGKTPPTVEYKTEFPLIEVNAINTSDCLVNYNVIRKYVVEETYNTWFRKHLNVNDVIVSTVGSIGVFSIFTSNIGCIAQNLIGLRSETVSPYFIYLFLKTNKEDILNLDIGGVQPSIKVPHLLDLKLKKPTIEVINKFHNLVKEYFNKIGANQQQIQTLTQLRDTLLPKLMSGEVRVKM